MRKRTFILLLPIVFFFAIGRVFPLEISVLLTINGFLAALMIIFIDWSGGESNNPITLGGAFGNSFFFCFMFVMWPIAFIGVLSILVMGFLGEVGPSSSRIKGHFEEEVKQEGDQHEVKGRFKSD